MEKWQLFSHIVFLNDYTKYNTTTYNDDIVQRVVVAFRIQSTQNARFKVNGFEQLWRRLQMAEPLLTRHLSLVCECQNAHKKSLHNNITSNKSVLGNAYFGTLSLYLNAYQTVSQKD